MLDIQKSLGSVERKIDTKSGSRLKWYNKNNEQIVGDAEMRICINRETLCLFLFFAFKYMRKMGN